jgi:hypothetical protein
MAWEGQHGQAYDEPVFRDLLALEQTRSERLGLPVLVVLVELVPVGGPDPFRTARLFRALAACVRETDIIGWHRRDRIAGIVFTELEDRSLAEVSRLLQARVTAALDRWLPRAVAYRVHVRTYRHFRPTGSMGTPAEVGA